MKNIFQFNFYSHKFTKTVVLILLTIIIIGSLLLFKAAWNASYVGFLLDDANYIILAKALLTKHAYISLPTPNTPPSRLFPPGFPILLMPFVAMVGEQYDQLKWFNIAIAAINIVLFYKLFSKRLPRLFIWFFLILLPLNSLYVYYSVTVMSDLFFLFLGLLFFLTIANYESKGSQQWISAFTIGIIIMASITIRVIGSLLLIPIICFAIKHRDLKIFIAGTLPSVALFSIANIYRWFELYPPSLIAPSSLNTSVVLENINYYFNTFADIFSGHYLAAYPFHYKEVFAFIGILIIVIGLIVDKRQFGWNFSIYVLSYLALLICYKLGDSRLLLPILPFIYYFFLQGLSPLLKKQILFPVTISIITFLIITTTQGLLSFFSATVFRQHPSNTLETTTFKWIKYNTKQKDLFQTDVIPRLYLYIGQQSIPFYDAQERYQLYYLILSANIKYILFTPPQFRSHDAKGESFQNIYNYWRMVNEDKHHFRLVFQYSPESSYIYEVISKQDLFLKALKATDNASILYQQKKYEDAINALFKALSYEPEFYLALNLQGIVLVDSGQVENGINVLTKSMTLYPSIERTYVALAYAYQKKGNHNKARQLLYYALKLSKEQYHNSLAQSIQQEIDKLNKKQ